MASRVVDKNAAHHACGHGEEVRAVGPLRARLIHELEIRLVDEGGRAERVASALSSKMAVRDMSELVVDAREKLIERFLIT